MTLEFKNSVSCVECENVGFIDSGVWCYYGECWVDENHTCDKFKQQDTDDFAPIRALLEAFKTQEEE